MPPRRIALSSTGILLALALFSAARADDWPACNAGNADEAIAACSRLIAFGLLTGRVSAMAYDSRGHARVAKGDLDSAISDFDEAIRLAPHFSLYYFHRGEARLAKGDHDGALADFDQASRDTEFVAAYAGRGEARQANGDFDGAIADFNVVIRLMPQVPEAYLRRGLAWEAKGNIERARADYSATLTMTSSSPDGLKAQQIAQEHLTALQKEGPISATARRDRSSQIGITLKTDGGTFIVPVEINGAITLGFVIDSGAADVSVPADVFSTLRRTGTIKDSDFIGQRTYVLADGSKSQSPTFMIRSLKVGDVVLENVTASVAPSQGSLLLGQSFLSRFKSWSIDNTKQELFLLTH